MVKNEAMANVFGNSAELDTKLIQKVEARDSEYDKARKKKAVSFGGTQDQGAAGGS